MPSGSFQWRGDAYRLDSSTWHFWGHARLIQLPGDAGTIRMTPDDALFIEFALNAGLEPNDNIETSAALVAGQAFLDQNGYHVWTVQQAIDIVRNDTDLHLAARLLEHLIYWFFVARL